MEGFTEEQQAVLHGDGPLTKLEYRLAWARSHLKGVGALNNSERGVWSTTEAGRVGQDADDGLQYPARPGWVLPAGCGPAPRPAAGPVRRQASWPTEPGTPGGLGSIVSK